jgi:hypothetical protein
LIDPRASEQVLELIVKIAEHPTTWKQIHRVLGKESKNFKDSIFLSTENSMSIDFFIQ